MFLAKEIGEVDRRLFALKIANESTLESPNRRERFLREGKVLSRLKHPNLVPVHEFGEVDGVCYLRSDYCDGPNLQAWIAVRRSPPDPRLAAEWMAQLADAVDYCHRQEVLHRDLKPSNVLFSTANAEAEVDAADRWRIRIADFGLARLIDDSSETRTGDVLGTPGYLAPEQAAGTGSVGPAADIWGLGAILYELLTLHPAIDGRNDIERLRRLLESDIDWPSRIEPTVPATLEAICLKCLENRPSERYRSAAELADDLRRWLEGRPVQARRPGPVRRFTKWALHRPSRAAAVTAVALTAAVIGIGGFAYRFRVNEAIALADREATERKQQEHKARFLERLGQWRGAYQSLYDAQPKPAFDLFESVEASDEGFELRHLDWLAHGCGRAAALPHRHRRPYAIAFSPNGNTVGIANSDHTAVIWDLKTRVAVAELRGHADEVNSISFSPDGKRAATVGDDRCVMLWDLSTGRKIASFLPEGEVQINECAFLDGERLLVLSRNHTLRCLSIDGLKEQWRCNGANWVRTDRPPWTSALAISPDRRFAAVGDRGCIVIHDLELRRPVKVDVGEEFHDRRALRPYYKLAYAQRGKVLIAAAEAIHILDADSLSVLGEISFRKGHSTSFSHCEKTGVLAVGRYSGAVELWDLATRRRLDLLSFHADRVWDLAISSDGSTVVSGGNDEKAIVWDIRERLRTGCRVIAADLDRIDAMAIDAAEGSAVLASVKGDVHRIRLDGGGERSTVRLALKSPIMARSEIALSPDGRLAAVSAEQSVDLYDTRTGRHCWSKETGSVGKRTFFSGDGRRALIHLHDSASPSPASRIECRDAETGALWGSIRAEHDLGIGVNRDGSELFALGDAGLTRCAVGAAVWPMTGRRVLPGERAMISHDNRFAVRLQSDGRMELWETTTAERIAALAGGETRAIDVAFSPDGRLLATCEGSGGGVQLWRIDFAPAPSVHLESGLSNLRSIAFSIDGATLYGVGETHANRYELIAWPAPPPGAFSFRSGVETSP